MRQSKCPPMTTGYSYAPSCFIASAASPTGSCWNTTNCVVGYEGMAGSASRQNRSAIPHDDGCSWACGVLRSLINFVSSRSVWESPRIDWPGGIPVAVTNDGAHHLWKTKRAAASESSSRATNRAENSMFQGLLARAKTRVSCSGGTDRQPVTGGFVGTAGLGLVGNKYVVILNELRNTSVLLRAETGAKRTGARHAAARKNRHVRRQHGRNVEPP